MYKKRTHPKVLPIGKVLLLASVVLSTISTFHSGHNCNSNSTKTWQQPAQCSVTLETAKASADVNVEG